MSKPKSPCFNCLDRVIDNGKKCEATCVKMAEFKRLNETYKNTVYNAKVALRVAQKPYRRMK